ncbi:hypothetical protein pb186bvf_001065 [Paramecium bursaria]
MGGGQSSTKAQTMQEQLQIQQNKQIKSSKYPPFSESEVLSLNKKFRQLDTSNRNSISLEQFKNLLEIRMHFFSQRIYQLIEFDMNQSSVETMDFQKFMSILSVFHPLTEKIDKLRYMFRIYDYNGDDKVTQDDLVSVFKLIYMQTQSFLRKNSKQRVLQTNFMNEDYVTKLGKDIMNIVDSNGSGDIDIGEFQGKFTDSDVQFRMNIVF